MNEAKGVPSLVVPTTWSLTERSNPTPNGGTLRPCVMLMSGEPRKLHPLACSADT